MTINDILTEYCKKLNYLDLELIIAYVVRKPREFVLTYPEYKLTKNQELKTKNLLARRMRNEPLAYILDHKEFFGLDFKINRHTLIPRPETELLVEEAIKLNPLNKTIIDIGAGSGNIIIGLAKNLKSKNKFIAIDISAEALKIAKHNAKTHKVDKKIKFLKGGLLEPILKSKNYKLSRVLRTKNLIILANLPYLSKEIYSATAPNVKKYEPKSALYSSKAGLDHYEKLLKQIKKMQLHAACYLEISPEQKPKITKLIKLYFPQAKLEFHKDLARKWRVCKFEI